jgi:hypothetical protein
MQTGSEQPPPHHTPHTSLLSDSDRTAKASTGDTQHTQPIIPSSTFPASAGHKIWIRPHQQLAPHSLVAKQRGSRRWEAL